jgi:hypothetical protein
MNKRWGRKKKKSFVLFTPPPFLLSQDVKLRVQGKTLDIVNESEKQNQSTFGRHSESNKQTKKISFKNQMIISLHPRVDQQVGRKVGTS